MISNKQKWLLGGLITFSAAIWTPQIMERVGSKTRAQVGLDSGPNEEEMLSIEMESLATGPSQNRPEEPERPRPSEGASRADTALPVGDSQLAAGGSSAIVSEVLRSLRQTEAFNVNTGLEELEQRVEATASEEEFVEEPPSLLVFLENHPLRGTIVGETTQMALIGRHRVQLGDVLPGTGAVLTEVSRGRVTVMEGDMSIELVLKPLETSAALMNARTQGRDLETSEGLTDTNNPEPTEAPEPSSGAPDSPAQGLPNPQGDF